MKKSWKFFAKIFGVEQSEKEKRENGYESETQEVKKETTEENSVDVDAQSSVRYSIDEKVFKIGKDIRKKSTGHIISLSLYVKMLIKNYG